MYRTRRQIIEAGLWIAGTTTLSTVGCATSPASQSKPTSAPVAHTTTPPPPPPGLIAQDLIILGRTHGPLTIVQRVPAQVTVLRKRARLITKSDFNSVSLLERRMRETLSHTNAGVGLAAPQVGIGARAIVVMLDARSDHPRVKFYLNPRIVARSDEVTADYEGCLSIKDVCGLVKRNRHIVVEHGLQGQPVQRLAVSDFNARIFQHEIDHLEGVLYIDRVDGEIRPRQKLQELREKLRGERPQVACIPPLYRKSRAEVLL